MKPTRRITTVLATLALAIASALFVAAPSADAHGTPYACNISGANIITHYGCLRAWKLPGGGLAGYVQDRHSDGFSVRVDAGGPSIWATNVGSSNTTTPKYWSTAHKPTAKMCLSNGTQCVNYTP